MTERDFLKKLMSSGKWGFLGLFISHLFFFSALAAEIEDFYVPDNSYVHREKSVDASLSLYSISLTDALKHKAKYKYSVEQNTNGLYERFDSWRVSLNLSSGLADSTLTFLEGSLGTQYVLRREYKTRKEALKAKIANPAKIPLRAKDINFLEVGSILKVPTEVRFGMKLSPGTFTSKNFVKGDVFALIKGIVDIHFIRESKNLVRIALVAGFGNEYGGRLRAGLLTPELAFSVLGHDVDKVWDLDLLKWDQNISHIKGTLLDYRLNLNKPEARSCYNEFFQSYFKLDEDKFPRRLADLKLKSLKVLKNCSKRTRYVKEVFDSKINLDRNNERRQLKLGLYKGELDYDQFDLDIDESKIIDKIQFIRKRKRKKNFVPYLKNHSNELFEFINIQSDYLKDNSYQFKYIIDDSKMNSRNAKRARMMVNLFVKELPISGDADLILDEIENKRSVNLRLDYQFQVARFMDSCDVLKKSFHRHLLKMNRKYPELFSHLYNKNRSRKMFVRMLANKAYEAGESLCHLEQNYKVKSSLYKLNRSEVFFFLIPSFLVEHASEFNLKVFSHDRQIKLNDNYADHYFRAFHQMQYFDDTLGLL